MSALDTQVGGGHYKTLKIQPVELIMSNHLGYCEGAVVKYLTRWRDKGGIEDVRKAAHFVQILMEDRDYQHRLEDRAKAMPVSAPIDGAEYCIANDIGGPSRMAIQLIVLFAHRGWSSLLEQAAAWIDDIITLELAKQ